MRKKLIILSLSLLLTVVLAFGLTACFNNSSSETTSSQYDSSSVDGSEEQDENGLEFNNIKIENNVGSISVSNATEKFSFADEIAIIGNAEYVVSLDEYGIHTAYTKIVPLNVGDNIFYIFESLNGKIQNTYIITIRRRHMYNVTFNTNGGSEVQGQQVEEGFLAVMPKEPPIKNGYEFTSWDYDFASPIMQNVTINANWSLLTYSITFDLAGGFYDGELPAEYTIESNFSLPVPTNTTEFLGWYYNGVKVTTLNGYYGNITLTARWESIYNYNYSIGQITGLKSKYNNLSQIVIPEEIDGEPVISIGDYAFYGCDGLTSVVIGDNVTLIGSYAFERCSSLTSVVIPGSVTLIDFSAFYGCNNLTEVNYLGSIDDWAQIEFSGSYANPLHYAKQLKINGEVVTEVNLTTATLISDYAFERCSSLTSVVIGDSVTSIGESAFEYCDSLTSVEILDSVTSIGEWAFRVCDSLTSVVIGDNVTSIGDQAFSGCSSLTNIEVDENNANYKSIDGNLYSKDGSVLIQYSIGKTQTSFEIPDRVTSIGSHAFGGCDSLTSVVIGGSVTSIGYLAFGGCDSLTSVAIGDSVTSIGDFAFYGCDSLTSVVIGDNVTSIGSSAFEHCSSLTSIVIPEGVTSIGEWAFRGCDSLIFKEYNNCKYLGSATNPYFVLIKGVNSNLSSITIHNNTKVIAGGAFYNYSRLSSIVIPDSVISICDLAFERCSSLTNIEVDKNNENYKSIDGNLYSKDGSVLIQYSIGKTQTSFEIPDSVTSIGHSAFYYCSSLTSVVIGDSVTSIGYAAFYDCRSLSSVVIGDSVTSIGSSAFYSCESLSSVVIGDSVTSIGNFAFYFCESLTSIKYRGSSSQWNAISKGSSWNYQTGSYTITYNYAGE